MEAPLRPTTLPMMKNRAAVASKIRLPFLIFIFSLLWVCIANHAGQERSEYQQCICNYSRLSSVILCVTDRTVVGDFTHLGQQTKTLSGALLAAWKIRVQKNARAKRPSSTSKSRNRR